MGAWHGHAAARGRERLPLHAETTFETFPFPHHTDEQRDAIAAAKRLDELREGWLNPDGASPEELEPRTLTKLSNAMPSWLRDAHATLDHSVLVAYAWPHDITDTDLLTRLLDLNLERAARAYPSIGGRGARAVRQVALAGRGLSLASSSSPTSIEASGALRVPPRTGGTD